MTPGYSSLRLFALLSLSALPSLAVPLTATSNLVVRANTHNDYTCRSSTQPNPVVLLHGLGATYYEDLNYLETYLQSLSFCTFSITYGDYPEFPYVGGLRPIADSSAEIASFIRTVQQNTGAKKINLLGHSEGAFMSLYVPKFESGISAVVDKIVAIAPPTRGTNFGGLYNLAYIGGNLTRVLVGDILDTVGCAACNDVGTGGAAVARLNDGEPIIQKGNTATIIISRHDELVTPTSTSLVNEAGVHNLYVQDFCPLDLTGHIGEAYDTNVWNLVVSSLVGTPEKTFTCSLGGFPGK